MENTGNGPRPAPLVLNVDDRTSALYLRDRVLRQHGFAVTNVESGHAAESIARRQPPDIVLLDVHLRDCDGRELCQRFKQDPELASIPIILISSTLSGHAQQLESLRWSGADGFLAEPVEDHTLVSTIRSVLATKR